MSNTRSPYIWEHRPDYHRFVCPGCKETHALNLGPGGWTVVSWVPLTLAPSVLVTGGGDPNYRCHSFIRNDKIEFLADCSHALAGKTVPMVDFDAWVAEQHAKTTDRKTAGGEK